MEIQHEHHLGPKHPAVTLIQYGDYECPYCAKVHPAIQKLLSEFDTELAFVYRHFPLVNIHPNAGIAAMASEAAGLQGKFWEMHNLLYKNSKKLSLEFILSLAKKLKLEEKKFMNDIESDLLWNNIQKNIESGVSKEVTGTPSFYINGKLFDGASTYESLKKVIQKEIEKRKSGSFHHL